MLDGIHVTYAYGNVTYHHKLDSFGYNTKSRLEKVIFLSIF